MEGKVVSVWKAKMVDRIMQHKATVSTQAGAALSIVERKTPLPAPSEVLVHVRAVAVNPVDYYQRDRNVPPVHAYPAVLGGDVAGVIASRGYEVPASLHEGVRVCAFASSFFCDAASAADHGGFQEFVVVPWQYVAQIPAHVSFSQAAMLPLATSTALHGWLSVDVGLKERQEGNAVLVWGASSSVGTIAVQSAKSIGFHVFATASKRNHAYVQSLGADRVFDYTSDTIIDDLAHAISTHPTTLTVVHCVVEKSLEPVLDVLQKVAQATPIKIIHSPILAPDHPSLKNVSITFNMPSLDSTVRAKTMKQVFHDWLQTGLETNDVVPSPHLQLCPRGGLEGINDALDALRNGVSCAKIVVEL